MSTLYLRHKPDMGGGGGGGGGGGVGGSFVDHNFLKAQNLRSILQHVSHMAAGVLRCNSLL